MQDSYIFIGGDSDGLNIPAHHNAETLHWPSGIGKRTTYHRRPLSLGYTSIVVHVHESSTPTQALNDLVEYCRAWCVNRPGGRRP